jgi:hypothetical protein
VIGIRELMSAAHFPVRFRLFQAECSRVQIMALAITAICTCGCTTRQAEVSQPPAKEQHTANDSEDGSDRTIAGRWQYPAGGWIDFGAGATYEAQREDGFKDHGSCELKIVGNQRILLLKSVVLKTEAGVEVTFITEKLAKLTYVEYPVLKPPARYLGTWPPAHFVAKAGKDGRAADEESQIAIRLQRILEKESEPPFQAVAPDADAESSSLRSRGESGQQE